MKELCVLCEEVSHKDTKQEKEHKEFFGNYDDFLMNLGALVSLQQFFGNFVHFFVKLSALVS
ncbi:MAG: hypothetical protein H0W12_02555 [Chitinophagaceae bacterium]|nr:hypothetical protein [Chitinophagaceae bacterium]